MGDRLIIPVGYFGNVDMSDIAAVVNHSHVQRLGNTMQLGLDHLIFRGVRHTRLEHSISVAALAGKSVSHLSRHGFDPAWEKPMRIYGLLHDLAHLAFGHPMEFEFKVNLDKRAIDLLDQPHPRGGPTIRETIQSLGVDDQIVQALMTHSIPEHQIVKDRNLGADKLGYVFMDNHYSYLRMPQPSLDALLPELRYDEGTFGVSEQGAQLLTKVMQLYIDLRLHLYGDPRCTTLERMLQKAVEIAYDEKEFTTKDVLDMDDVDLESILRTSWNDDVREISKRIRYGEIPPIAAVFQYGKREDPDLGNASVRHIPLSFLENFYAASRDPHDLTRIECRIAEELQIPVLDVYVPQPPNLKKTYPRDTPIIGTSGVIGSVFEKYPQVQTTLKRKVNQGVKVYVCATRPYDLIIRDNVDKVHEILDEELGKFSKK